MITGEDSERSALGLWRKASFSGGSSNCVEVATSPTTHALRDSKNRDAGAFFLSRTEWTAFLTAVKREEL
ncbi:DUF397 domain-containing protein [Marinitenerispora sediminis]|uniref:DUF397 domain-containing protein n=1 Tax=Marinitenerispora sediminis TaxID=1931232 RepID=A0A368T5A2_9ACTN|nr:DUF397 domain-containing protein [Marinitenerispora sediminis]RCV48768.1 DUF397 domain-containing protein [Marinitenerispora sediminis]RCV50896.1 DUF397 domain-containing protein [Marinitenerispora sediminis]RCV58674.1 DUF397 domain-containing protein [Marinitenerispora sediminis]